MSNSLTIKIPGINGGMITCVSHAAYDQKLVISGFPNENEITFTGTGENVPMTTKDGSSVVYLTNLDDGVELTFTFSYKKPGDSNYQPAGNVGKPIIHTNPKSYIETLSIESEDVQVNAPDTNDTSVQVTYMLK